MTLKQQNLAFVAGKTVGTSRALKLLEKSGITITRMTLIRYLEGGKIAGFQPVRNGWWRVSYDSLIEFINAANPPA